MKEVPLRRFQQKASEYIKELPVALTRYGRVVAYVSKSEVAGATDTSEPSTDDRWGFKPCKHGLNPELCKDRKCRGT